MSSAISSAKGKEEKVCEGKEESGTVDEPVYTHANGREVMKSRFTKPWKLEDRDCSICHQLFKDPIILDNTKKNDRCEVIQKQCGHIFCRSCITVTRAATIAAGIFNCPQCKRDSIGAIFFPAEQMAREIAKLDIKCEYESKGCKRVGQFGIDGAEDYAHSNSCPHRGAPCPACGEVVVWGKESAHTLICPATIVRCEIDSRCKEEIKRREVKAHSLKCRYRSEFCPMKMVGCAWIGALADLDAHILGASEEHVALVRQKVDDDEKKTKSLIEELKGAQTQIDNIKRKLYDEVGSTTIEVKWNEPMPDSDYPIKLMESNWVFGIKGRTLWLRSLDIINSEAYVVLLGKEVEGKRKNVHMWHWKVKDNTWSGITNALTSELISSALNPDGTIHFGIGMISCNGIYNDLWNNLWNSRIKKLRI